MSQTRTAMRFIAHQIDAAFSRKDGLTFQVMLVPRGGKAHCGRCQCGVVLRFDMGQEPEISNCKVCGAKTEVHLRGIVEAQS